MPFQKNLHRLVKDSVKKIDIYQMLHILLNIQSEKEFQEVLEKFVDHYKQTEPAFIQYFEDHYTSRSGNDVVKLCVN